MNYLIRSRKPEKFFNYFEQICSIPHGSFDEEKIADYLVKFAKLRSLEYVRDEYNNVLIKRPATIDRKGESAILIQGHTDMVCEANMGKIHDFKTQPLELRLDGKYLYADGTSLGADDGVAVAAMLTLLDGELPSHPDIECLFTSAEEVGLIGACHFDTAHIKARRMINLDAENDCKAIVGCAGGIRSDVTLPVKTRKSSTQTYKIILGGLMGGHSGECIREIRGNACRLMARVILILKIKAGINLVSINGGNKDNAIPRECVALVNCSHENLFDETIKSIEKTISAELSADDKKFYLNSQKCDSAGYVLDTDSENKILSIILSVQNGVIEMSPYIGGLVEFSRNLGVVSTDKEKAIFHFSSRSSFESKLDYSTMIIDHICSSHGASVTHHSRYPGWSYAEVSPLRDRYIKAYSELFSEEPKVEAIHAGLECGIIKSKIPDMDVIALGANMFGIHSPDEKLDLDSCEKLWRILAKVIGEK